MSEHQIIAPQIKEGIDRKQLKTLKGRFLAVNAERLRRTLEGLSPKRQQFLHALPLLLHVNHASLPGYITPKTPVGVRHFVPEKHHLLAARNIARAFTYNGSKLNEPDLLGIFLMGSTGTIAQSEKSDLDFWICHRSDLPPKALQELQDKLTAISRWASGIGLEAHFFLMDAERFKRGERGDLSGEDCGSTQHYLLLDEFYRSSLLIAGCAPLWWMVPAYEEKFYDAYASEMLQKRFLEATDFIDFGGISDFPAGEFVGAGLWQLYKGIDSPYKSVLKIILTEVYASEHPNVECLSVGFKKALYHGETLLDHVDPYVMMYRKIERYLESRQEFRRLELVRHCFYFKVGESLSRDASGKPTGWRFQLMERLATQWHWDTAYIKALDNRKRWRVVRVQQERQELVHELNYSYRLLSSFARQGAIESSIRQQDMQVLGRRLHAAFERTSGKVEQVNPGMAHDLREDALSLHYIYDAENPSLDHYWVVQRGYVKARDIQNTQEPLRKSRSLIELLAWCIFNRLLDESTHISADCEGSDLTETELKRLTQHFFQQFPTGAPVAQESAFSEAARPSAYLLFINVGLDPLRELTRRGIHRLSNQTDALSYSAMRHNLVLTVDQVLFNSWGEVLCSRYDGETALLDCLQEFLRRSLPGNPLPEVQIRCECPTRPTAIVARVEELFADLSLHFCQSERAATTRYLLEMEQQYFLLRLKDGVPLLKRAQSREELLERLAEPHPRYSPIVPDRRALNRDPLREVLLASAPNCIQVFYQRRDDWVVIYVLDENGCLFHTTRPWNKEGSVLAHFQHFFESVYLRRQAISQRLPDALMVPRYYELITTGETTRREARPTPSASPLRPWHNVQAFAEHGNHEGLSFTIRCDGADFSELEHGARLYERVAEFITQRRHNQARYPCYITDLDLMPLANNTPLQPSTCDYLRHKELLEQAINRALYPQGPASEPQPPQHEPQAR
ncbi:Adenylate cyclase [gamma proteobacterium HdN1]|nr:Adenylate cyclase [gamma proteobacterium HdN1]